MIWIIAFLIIIAMVLKDYSLKHVLEKVSYLTRADNQVVEPGEEFSVTTTLHNNKWLPVTFIKISELIPSALNVVNQDVDKFYTFSENGRMISTTYLMPYQKYTRSYKATIDSRGRYFLHGATLYGGDIFGIGETVEHVTLMEEIVVLPKAISSGKLDAVLGGFLGDFSVNRFIMEDPILTIGFRDYTGREPMKDINWPQSLKANKLMVKNFDHTTDLSVTVILNVECSEDGKEIMSARQEAAFSVARYVCEYLENKRIKYSFTTNATAAGAIGKWNTITEGLGRRHLYTIIEGLGRATYDSTMRFGNILEKAAFQSENGRAHIVITPDMLPCWEAPMRKLYTSCDGHVAVIRACNFVTETKEGE